jgi:dipeptidyl aminopeptidase/acylaminoacyl peptidase
MRLCSITVLVFLSPFATAAAAPTVQTHPFNVRDLIAFDRIADPAVSPDGTTVAFTVSSLDLDANRRQSDLWIVGMDGSDPKQLTSTPANHSGPTWSPDGRWIWFRSNRSGSSQVWKIPVDGGEARQVTQLPLDIGSFRLSSNGTRLAVSMEVFPGASPGETTRRLEEQSKSKATGRLYDRLLYRHWDTWKDGRRSHLFVLTDGGDPVDVMKAMDADAPSMPFGGTEEYTFSPDDQWLVFTARDAGREEAWSTDLNLWAAPVDGSTAPRNLTADNPATDTQPSFSPDGATLVWLAMRRAGYESDRLRVMLMPWPDGKPRELTWDRSPNGLTWARDGKTLLATADNLGHHSLFALDIATGSVREIIKEGHARAPVDAGERIVFGLDSFRSPVELYTARPDGSERRQITRLNRDRLAAVRMGEPSQFTFVGAVGDKVYGWIVKPADFDPAKKYPVAFLIHGGPQGSWANDFHYRWNPQTYAGAGYAVVMVDFHGSTGYGQAFTDSIRGDWGGKPLEDLRKGLAAALDANPWMDGDRACALGASFGGYMINWIAGNWPDRFRCLVNHDGNLDERFAYFDTEELWFPEWDHDGTPWDNPQAFAKHNPIEHVAKWRSPMLVIHGALDFRVVDTQGMATFTALQRQGIPSRFLHFPDENHWVLKPHNSILWHDTVLAWLAQWTE